MKMNYREKIVYDDLKKLGYELLFNKETGYPDFKAINLIKKEMFYVEVKSVLNSYKSTWKKQISEFTGKQKEVFNKLVKEGNEVLIAIPHKGILRYENFKDKSLWREVFYDGSDVILKTEKCKICGNEWIPRVENPKQCPNCKSLKWKEKKK